MSSRSALRRTLLTGLAVLGLILVPPARLTGAVFDGVSAVNGNTFGSAQMFYKPRTTAAHELRDFSSGTEAAGAVNPYAEQDDVWQSTKGWPSTFDSTKYMELRFASALPAGFPLTNQQIRLTFSAVASGDTFCLYIETYRFSTATYRGAFGSPTDPDCATGSFTVTYALSAAVNTTVANDYMIGVFGRVGTAGNTGRFDQATIRGDLTVNGTTTPVVQHVGYLEERQDGVSSVSTYALADAGDSRSYTSSSTWPTTRSTSRYLSARVPWTNQSTVPTNATITSAVLRHIWRPGAGSNACYDLMVYSPAGTLLHSSDSANPTCHAAGSAALEDTWDLSSVVTTPARANGLTVRFVYRSGDGATRTVHSYLALATTYGIG